MDFLLKLLLITIFSNNIFSQNIKLDWAISNQGSNSISTIDMTIDVDGNIYITGYFRSTIDFDPGADTFFVTSNGFRDVFIQKLDSNGNLLWVRTFGSTGNDSGRCINIDRFGNLFVIGRFENEVDLNGGIDEFMKTSNGEQDIFIEKLDVDGNFIWAKSFGGVGDDWSNDLVIDSYGNLYISGSFSDEIDFNETDDVELAISVGDKDAFVLKLTNEGDLIWVRTAGGPEREFGMGITIVEEANMICLTGEFRNIVDFNPSAEDVANLTSNGLSDVFIWSLDIYGNYNWAKNIGGTSYDSGNDLEADISGNLFVSGYFNDSVDFNHGVGTDIKISAGLRDMFILKLDALGEYISSIAIGGNGNDDPVSLTIDEYNKVFTSGYFSWTVDFDPDPYFENYLTSVTEYDGFLMKVNNELEFEWAYSLKGTEDESCNTIMVDPESNIYTGGWFRGIIDFDPSEAEYNIESLGDADGYVVKFEECLVAKSSIIDESLFASPSGATYQWIDCKDSLAIAGATSQTFSSPSNGNYAVIIIKDGCIDTSACYEIDGVGIEENPYDEINVYPNPSSGLVNLQIDEAEMESINLYNSMGQLIISWNVNSATAELNLKDFERGVYSIVIKTTMGLTRRQIVLQ